MRHIAVIDALLGALWPLFRLAAGGFQPVPCQRDHDVIAFDGVGREVSLNEAASDYLREARTAWVFPTHAGRRDTDSVERHFLSFCDQSRARTKAHAVAFLAVQWKAEREQTTAIALCRRLLTSARGGGHAHVVGIVLKGRRKADSLNAVLGHLEAGCKVEFVGWVDDDVRLEPDCLRRLIDAIHESKVPSAVGARKIGHARGNAASRTLRFIKAYTQAAMNYPHGCCLLVHRSVVRSGIPTRYMSDDGFVCFELLKPNMADVFTCLRIIPDAVCHHFVGTDRLSSTLARIRRMMINHIVMMGDYPKNHAVAYMKHSLFVGAWPCAPGALGEGLIVRSVATILKLFFLSVLIGIALELTVRRLRARPLSGVSWGGTDTAEAPR